MAMAGQIHYLLLMVVLLMTIAAADYETSTFNRSSFPSKFLFGTASSAYQYEGAYNKDGKGPSIWDTYTREHPEGKLKGGVNKKGIQFYNNLIDELLSKGLQPFVTLFHWDVPQNLEDEYGGFLSSNIMQDFQDYVELCYKEFGDRVKHWITLNEPLAFSVAAYSFGILAPGRCSRLVGNCSVGNSATEPYIVSHNQLLAHAAAVKVYKAKYQAEQKGKIGITLVSNWVVPYTRAKVDKDAAKRAMDFMLGWFMDPLTYGHYPRSMESLVGNRLPNFSKEQSDMVQGSFDFIGLNYYTASYAVNDPLPTNSEASYLTDRRCNLTSERNGVLIGPKAGSSWIYMYPRGIRDILIYTKKKYKNPIIYITENGVDEVNNGTQTLEEALTDNTRIQYYYHHLSYVLRAINKGIDIRGYFAWTLLDDFEWSAGYTSRFGIHYVDFKTSKRYHKLSSIWFKKFLFG